VIQHIVNILGLNNFDSLSNICPLVLLVSVSQQRHVLKKAFKRFCGSTGVSDRSCKRHSCREKATQVSSVDCCQTYASLTTQLQCFIQIWFWSIELDWQL